MTHFHLFLNGVTSMRHLAYFPMFHHFLALFLIRLTSSPYIGFLKKHNIPLISCSDDIFKNFQHSFFMSLRVIKWFVPEKSLRHETIFVFQEKFKKFLRIFYVSSNIKNEFIAVHRQVGLCVNFIFTFCILFGRETLIKNID